MKKSKALDSPPKPKSRYERLALGPAKTHQKEWKIHDFVGRYHLTRVKNPAPVPGMTLGLEKEEANAKAADTKRFEDQLEQRALQYKRTVRARAVGTAEATKLHMDAVIGTQIEKTDEILHGRATEVGKKSYFSDTPDQIKRFKKNVMMDRPHYVGYAVISTGFRSMAWQDEETGDSFAHMAVKNGYIDLLGELLKYKADANLVNKMGNAPLHEAWYQWVPPPNTAEVRRTQEARTCAILRHLLKWNAYPDNLQKSDGNTALHIAARRGPVKAVVILLGFNADDTIRNRSGLTAIEIAVSHNQGDIVKVLSNWNIMKKQSQHEDFSILWKRFIADHEIPMSNEPDAKTTIYKLHMRDSVNRMTKSGGGDYMIDDPLIQRARTESIVSDQDIPLKPWDPKYQAARSKKVRAVAMPKGKYLGEVPLETSRPARGGELVPLATEGGSASDTSGIAKQAVSSPGRHLASAKMKRRNITNLYSYLIHENRPQTSLPPAPLPILPVVDDGSIQDCEPSLEPRSDFEDEDIVDPGHEKLRAVSAIKSRRLSSAQKIVRDAKFELCTVRPCTSSSLMLSRRMKTAPLFGTEEQKSLGRFLSSKHSERPKSPPKIADLVGDGKDLKVKENFNKPPVTPMGAYRPVTLNEVYSENDKLYKRLQSTDFYAAKRRSETTMNSLNDAMGGSSAADNDMRGTMVPMVHARARSIEDRVVPPRKILSHTDRLNKEAVAAKTELKSEQDDLKKSLEVETKRKKKNVHEVSSPPKKVPIKYGACRLKSAEMTTQPIDPPWSSVTANYTLNCSV